MLSQNAPVIWPPNIGKRVDSDVISGSHGNGDAGKARYFRNGKMEAEVDVRLACQSSGDAGAAVSELDRPSGNIHSHVRQLSHSLQLATTSLLCLFLPHYDSAL